jgi:hypothetical protein
VKDPLGSIVRSSPWLGSQSRRPASV